MGNSCRGSFKDKLDEGDNNKPEDYSKTSTTNLSSNSDHSPNAADIIAQEFSKDNNSNNNSKDPALVIPLREPIMRRNPDNQAYYVLGHKTPNIRDIYTLSRKLGQGQFGTTYLCTEIASGVDYACKSISKRKLISKEDVEDVRREIQIMHHLAGHGSIVTIKGAYEDSLYVHIVMELCAGGELFDRIIQRGHYSEAPMTSSLDLLTRGKVGEEKKECCEGAANSGGSAVNSEGEVSLHGSRGGLCGLGCEGGEFEVTCAVLSPSRSNRIGRSQGSNARGFTEPIVPCGGGTRDCTRCSPSGAANENASRVRLVLLKVAVLVVLVPVPVSAAMLL